VTLTAILPSLRRSIPDPLDPDRWPELTLATTTDVVVSGLALLPLVELSGTPCSLGGCSVLPSRHGKLSQTHRTIVTVFCVESVDAGGPDGPVIHLDGVDDCATQVWSEARLIGRASTAHAGAAIVVVGTGLRATGVTLPRDIHAGDLIAAPAQPVEAPSWSGSDDPAISPFIIQDVVLQE